MNIKPVSLILSLSGLLIGIFNISAQIIPISSGYNANIEWEKVFTDGPPGKVNRAVVDSDGNYAVIFMPDDQSRIHKIDGRTGERIWTVTIDNTAGFGISEIISDTGRCDYIVSGGIGETQERWLARLNGSDGSAMWSKTYHSEGESWQYDAIRMTIVGSDGYIYGAGFIGGDEQGTIFMVYGGEAAIMKIDPDNGDEIWTHSNPNTAYALAVVEASDGMLYYGGKPWDEDLTLTKLSKDGTESWIKSLPSTEVIIPSDLAIDTGDTLYYGGHSGRSGAGHPFDYSCAKLDTAGNVNWVKHYANPRGYSMSYIRSELYGIKVGTHGVYMFGGTGDENEGYSVSNPPFTSSDTWNGWALIVDRDGNIMRSDVYCQEEVNTATEYGCITDNGYVIFNDTDAQGDTEVGVMKIVYDSIPGSGTKYNLTTSSTSGGSVSPDGTNSCLENTHAPITATADSGYEFDHWTGDASGSENPMAVTMNSDKNITAHFVLSTASVQNIADSYNIIVYPNPAKGEIITIQIPDVEGVVDIEITDINGRLVIGRNEQVYCYEVVQLPKNSLDNGIYLISISSDNFRHHQKLIIE
jgi:hypothetical protein